MADSSNGPKKPQSEKLFRKQRVALKNLGGHAVDTPEALLYNAKELLESRFSGLEKKKEGGRGRTSNAESY